MKHSPSIQSLYASDIRAEQRLDASIRVPAKQINQMQNHMLVRRFLYLPVFLC